MTGLILVSLLSVGLRAAPESNREMPTYKDGAVPIEPAAHTSTAFAVSSWCASSKALAVIVTQDQAVQQSKRHNWDLGLTFVSLTGSAIATGITAACTSTNECAELNPLLRKVIKESMAGAIILKSSLNAGMHFLILRYMPEGRWRTVSLAVVAGINWLDAGNDLVVMRKIVRNR